ncbi:protease complex subunit PrcB family protein [Ammoniphilus sp. YIM 78166]|uniref:protease complex subunit PrcB family protein n=1 Tax=Ammoniphilus sp. YIM 78166 TaxID=1644106 RepID=UPI0010702FB5|nr:protease complex subunit PrcB family protein [Ammoniphilus sp. YIM 78166]
MKHLLMTISCLLFTVILGCSSQGEPNSKIDSVIPIEIINTDTFNFWIKEKEPQGIWFNETMNTKKEDRGIERFDYGDKTYLLISSGIKPSGFYEIELKEITDEEGVITIVAEDVPPQRSETPSVMENPRLLMSIDRTDKDVQLEWHES